MTSACMGTGCFGPCGFTLYSKCNRQVCVSHGILIGCDYGYDPLEFNHSNTFSMGKHQEVYH